MEKEYEVRGLYCPTILPGKLDVLDDVEIAHTSLIDREAIAEAVRNVDRVVHLAVLILRGDMQSEALLDIDTLGTRRPLETLLDGNRQIERFVFTNTDGTYHNVDPCYPPIGSLQKYMSHLPMHWPCKGGTDVPRCLLGYESQWTHARMQELALAHQRGEGIGSVRTLVTG